MNIGRVNAILTRTATRLMLDENALLEQENIDPAEEAFDAYLSDLVNGLIEEYDLEEDNAWDVFEAFLDDMVSEGVVPDIPTEDDPGALTGWVTEAKQVGLGGKLKEWVEENIEFE